MKNKRKSLYLILFSMFAIISIIMLKKNDKSTEIVDVNVSADYLDYDYTSLKHDSSVIALVEVLDDLDETNSTIRYDELYDYMFDMYATRKVKVIKYYKNNKNSSDVIEVLEPAAIQGNKRYLIGEYTELKKGEKYLLFLADNSFIMSAENGKFLLNNIEDSEFYEVGMKALIDLESDLNVREKEEILNSDIQPNKLRTQKKTEVITIDIDEIDFSLDFHF